MKLQTVGIAALLPFETSGFGAAGPRSGACLHRLQQLPDRRSPAFSSMANDCNCAIDDNRFSQVEDPLVLRITSAAPLRKVFVCARSGKLVSMDTILGDGADRERPTLLVFLRHLG
jgi:hypothetical protein